VRDGPLARVLAQLGNDRITGDELLTAFAERLSGADLTTFLLEVHRRRAARVSASDVIRAYERDRFVAPSSIDLGALRAAEDVLLRALPAGFDLVGLAPVLPLGAHSALSSVPQNNVLSTSRGTDVAADPTTGLALEAAVRRRALLRERARSTEVVRLASVQRIVRAQRFEGPLSFPHFTILGVVSAGRNARGLVFERAAAAEHVKFHINALEAAGASSIEVRLSDLSDDGRDAPVIAAVHSAIDGAAASVIDDPDRVQGRGYYRGFAFSVAGEIGAMRLDVGDGGFVDWTQQLVASGKERLLISGIGVDRVAIAMTNAFPQG